MKKMKIKEVKTVVSYLGFNECGQMENKTLVMEGKLNERKVMKEMEDVLYLNNSVTFNVETTIYQIPMSVIEELIHASANNVFIVDYEIKDTTVLWLSTPLWFSTEVSQLNTLRTTVYDVETMGFKKVEWVVIPTAVYEYLLREYEVSDNKMPFIELADESLPYA